MICFAFLLMSQMSSKSHFPSLGYSSKFLQFCFCLYWGFFVCFWRQRVASFFSLLSISWPDWLVFFLQAQAYVYKGKHKYTNSYMNKIWYAALSPSLLMFFFFIMCVMLEFVCNILCHNSWIISIEEIWNSHAGENLVTECFVWLPKSVAVVFMKFYFSDFFLSLCYGRSSYSMRPVLMPIISH